MRRLITFIPVIQHWTVRRKQTRAREGEYTVALGAPLWGLFTYKKGLLNGKPGRQDQRLFPHGLDRDPCRDAKGRNPLAQIGTRRRKQQSQC